MSELPPLSWGKCFPENICEIPAVLDQLHAAGVRRISLESPSLKHCGKDKAFRDVLLRETAARNMLLHDTHAPFGAMESLGYPVPGKGEIATNSVRNAIEMASILGIQTLTVHLARTRLVGPYAPEGILYLSENLPAARERILRQLDVLVPLAEKNKVVIALENLFLPSSTAAFLATVVPEINSPYLGYCYDAGHALLLENQPGKRTEDLIDWVRNGWSDDKVILQPDQLDIMLPHVVTCHLHDNHGLNDEHLLPGNGAADWTKIVDRLKTAPRLISLQTELIHHVADSDPLEDQIAVYAKIGLKL